MIPHIRRIVISNKITLIPKTNRKNLITTINRLLHNGLNISAKHQGLFGIPSLKSSNDFLELTKLSIHKLESIRNYIYSQQSKTMNSKECLNLLDEISSEICSIIDVAELCRNIHVSLEYKQSAEQSFEVLSKYIHNLNTDNRLYQKLVDIINNSKEWNTFTEEEKIFAIDLKREFEADGIHLEQTTKALALQLQSQVVQYESIFSQNINNNINNNQELILGPFHEKDYENVYNVKHWLEKTMNIPQRSFLNSEKYITTTTDRRLTYALLSQIDNPVMRAQLWTEVYHNPSANIEVLGGLIQSRQSLAKVLGYPSYAHKFLSSKVLNKPEKVQELLLDLHNSSKTEALHQLKKLSDLKASENRLEYSITDSSNIGASTKDEYNHLNIIHYSSSNTFSLDPWDISYYSSSKYDDMSDDSSRQRALTKVREYLSLESCIEGLKLITNQLFAITLEPIELINEEDWTFVASKGNIQDSPVNQSSHSIRKFRVLDDKTGKLIGTVFMDLYERDNKFPGAAHFTIQCGCERLHMFDTQSRPSMLPSFQSSEQLPIVALVFNFKLSSMKNTLLSLQDVETLHHEWGHALHSLLSRTKFQHLSGTRGSTDFIEIPSHWFEFYARCPEVISKWARHYITGESIPSQLLKNALASSKQFSAIDLQNQILYSAADQYLFGTEIGDVSALSCRDVYFKAVDGLALVQQKYSVLPIGRPLTKSNEGKSLPSMSLLTHNHFVNYGGGYYSYLFAKMYASQIWYHHFASDPLNRSAGEFLYNKLLKFGSSRPANEMLMDAAKGNLNPSFYLKSIFDKP